MAHSFLYTGCLEEGIMAHNVLWLYDLSHGGFSSRKTAVHGHTPVHKHALHLHRDQYEVHM